MKRLLLLVLLTFSVRAELHEIASSQTLDALIETARRDNAVLRAARAKAAAMSERPAQEKALPNPMFKYGAMDSTQRGNLADAGEKRFGFLTISPVAQDRSYVYVGEIAPVRIQAWIPADARAQLRSGIQPEGKAFTLHHVSDRPQQTQEIKDGKRYLVVTWYGGISATKAGKYPAALSVDVTVAVRDTAARQPRRNYGIHMV